jgi:hypothetical protein
MKIECIVLKPDCGQSPRQGSTVVGWLAHIGGWVAFFGARSGPTLARVVLSRLLPEFHDFCNRICFVVVVCLCHTYFLVYLLCTTCGDTHIQRNSE